MESNSQDPSSAASESSERVLYQRFAVGSCSFDAGLERRIFAQMILSEVQQLESVILNFDTRLRDESYRGLDSVSDGQRQRGGSMVEGAGISGTVCGRLTAHLLQKVEELKCEIGRDE